MSQPINEPQIVPTHHKVIHKYELDLNQADAHEIPSGKVRHVGWQGKDNWHPVVWVEHAVDANGQINSGFTMVLIVRATGQDFDFGTPPPGLHVGTAICGPVVWHIYRHISGPVDPIEGLVHVHPTLRIEESSR